jgi:hypothetical protein
LVIYDFSGAIDGSDVRSLPPPAAQHMNATQWHAANYAAGDKTQQVGKNRATN